jgi:Flp pilus assembly pilin Flp
MISVLKELIHDERGATTIEYGLITALVSIAMIVTLQAASQSLIGFLSFTSSTLDTTALGM